MDRTCPPIPRRGHSEAGSSQSPLHGSRASFSCQYATAESSTQKYSSYVALYCTHEPPPAATPSCTTPGQCAPVRIPAPSAPLRYLFLAVLFHHRQIDKALHPRRMVNPLRRLLILYRLGPENIRHERLRVPVVQ